MAMLALTAFAAFLVLLAVGVPIYVSLIGVAAVLILLEGGSIAGIGQSILDHMNSATLMAVPFFVLAAGFIQGGGMAKALIDMAAVWVGRLPGGVPVAAVLATAVFAAINGSSVATALAMGTLIVPEMMKRGYQRSFALGLTAAAGTLGILIPPSMPLVLYGLIAEESIPRLFLAGVVPGLIQVVMFATIVMVLARRYGGRPEPFPGWSTFARANVRAAPALVVPIIVLGGIYGGIVTVTEAAALSAAVALLVGVFIYRALRFVEIPRLLTDGMSRTAAILVIVAGAGLLSHWITRSGLPNDLVDWVIGFDLAPWQFLLVMALILLALGTILEGIAIILITLPLTLPILAALDISLVHYAIVITIAIEVAMLTPPVGLNLFVMAEVARAPVSEVIRGVLPFLAAMVILLLLVIFIPEIATWLPDLVFGPR
ncbi:MAG: TRAP transporter large permease [Microvirga sp.]|nr:TRAP transporter large permease [Microvirga sp.]